VSHAPDTRAASLVSHASDTRHAVPAPGISQANGGDVSARAQGPLTGVRVLEFAGLGPAPFCAMLLSDLGADVVCIDRPGTTYDRSDVEARGRTRVQLDLKDAAQLAHALTLLSRADVLIEGFRPGP